MTLIEIIGSQHIQLVMLQEEVNRLQNVVGQLSKKVEDYESAKDTDAGSGASGGDAGAAPEVATAAGECGTVTESPAS